MGGRMEKAVRRRVPTEQRREGTLPRLSEHMATVARPKEGEQKWGCEHILLMIYCFLLKR